jgi:hypothetical protein
MLFHEELASERARVSVEQAEQMRYWRRLRTLRRASRIERRAERRLVSAWSRAAEMRGSLEPAEY